MTSPIPNLSIVIPVYSEAQNIDVIIGEIEKALELVDLMYELIFVDDGSVDNSWEIIQQSVPLHPQVRAIRFSRNFGKEYALYAGLEAARGQAVVTLDGDQQHPPALIPIMIDLWKNQEVNVIDVIKNDHKSRSLFNRSSSRLFYYSFSKLSGLNISNSTDFKLLDRKVIDAILQFKETGFFYRGLVNWMGFKHVSISIDVNDRLQGETKWSLAKLTTYALNNIFNYTTKPLVFIGISGLLFILSALVLFLISIIR
jgi:dolichol-phosphate mannosyltransferase